ncbi:sensor histidine kinase [Actinoplanes sp. NBRC 101535]|uniref:sensor histidine kinase n=1 Tax=Actinoplanes sp. NBRC 101535 TaxID=3032196 RepID=UPI002557A1D4|nr:sensor histidine kinase [Actinoplanes sp. NBRC 101535]
MGTNGARPVRMQWWLLLGLSAGLLLVATATITTSVYEVPVLLAYMAASAQCAALPLVLLRPHPATVLQFAGVAMFSWSDTDTDGIWPLPVPVLVVLVLHIGLIGARCPWKEAVATWWASAFFCIVLVVADPLGRGLDHAEASLIIYATNSVLVLFGAILWSQRAAVHRELVSARRDVLLEQTQRALVEERGRIARELHDVVAHSMSVIHMQATSAAYRLPGLDPEARAEFSRIAADTRTTLREMRRLLAVLREETAGPELHPVPDLGGLGELAASARRGGIPVDVEVTGDLPSSALPDTVGLAAYRIVQESLSNVVRHAPGAATRVKVAASGTELLVEVVNGRPTGPARPIEEPQHPGHGLIGMRERARLAGGTMWTGPHSHGGYRVVARFPLPADSPAQRLPDVDQ